MGDDLRRHMGIAPLVRVRIILALLGLVALAGCVGSDAPVGPDVRAVDTRMPLAIDYYNHHTVHPVHRHSSGRVDPVDPSVGRERNFGPEPAADPETSVDRRGTGAPAPAADPDPSAEPAPAPEPAPPAEPQAPAKPVPAGKPVSEADPRPLSRPDLLATLQTLRASMPAGAETYLSLAKTRKAKRKVADTSLSAPDGDALSAGATDDGARTADNRGVEDRDGGYRLNFEDAEVKDVLQAILGNVLGLSYTIAPNVTGRITISSSATQSRTELLSTLETVLSMQGLSLTRTGATYRVAPMSVGGGTLDANGNEPGFGISVVPLQYSSVASMNKLLSGFVTDADGIRIDSSRNTVIVRGPGPRREEIVRAIKAFDGDWMHTQSVSMFELKRSHPDEVIQELNRIFNADANTDGAGVIEFKSVKRLRSIMVISKNDTLIRRAGAWIRRLDHQDTSETSSIFVYRPHYRDARELTKLVNGLFGQADSSGGSGVSFQQSSLNGQGGSSGQNGQGGSQSSNGLSSASYAGGLGGSGGSSSSGGGLGSSGGSLGGSGGGLGGSGGSLGGNSSGSSFGGLSSGGNGLKGDLADPIEAGGGRSEGMGDKLKLTADVSNNTIVAYTDGETYAKVRSVLTQLDIPPLQVAVNVVIAEVQLNDELKYGVQFFLNQSAKSVGSFGFSPSTGSAAQSVASGLTSGLTGGVAGTVTQSAALAPANGFNFITGGAASPSVILSALDSISKVHILSTPSIVVMENKAATLEVGNQVPVTTQSAQSNLTADAPTVNSVTYLNTGIILKIIPRVGQNGVVDMQVDQEISSVVPDASGSTTSSLTPTISTRRIVSDISVKSGQNVLLAGLVTDTRSKSNGQVPFVGPTLGNLLGNTDNIVSRDELVVFIRPVIVRSGQDAVSITQDFKQGLTALDVHAPPVYKP